MFVNLSVIVPIYNVEKYLPQCLDSLIGQTFDNLEIILVDDGSTDGCCKICDEYALKSKKIKVIHKKNGGLVSARQEGVKASSGTYITFVDSDDWVDLDYYQQSMENNNDADIFMCGFISEFDDGSKVEEKNICQSGEYTGESLVQLKSKCLYTGEFFHHGIYPAVWCKIYKKSLVEKFIFGIDPLIKMGEDAALTYVVLQKAQKVIIQNDILKYHYRRLNSSMSTSYDKMYFKRIHLLYQWLKKNFDQQRNALELNDQLNYYFANLINTGVYQYINALKKLKSKKTISKDLNQKWVKDVFAGIQKDQIPEDVAQLKAIIDGGHAKSWFIRICINKFLNRKKNCIRRKNG